MRIESGCFRSIIRCRGIEPLVVTVLIGAAVLAACGNEGAPAGGYSFPGTRESFQGMSDEELQRLRDEAAKELSKTPTATPTP